MIIPEALKRIIAALDNCEIPYMLSGSFASAYYGSLRSTQDIDLVIQTSAPKLKVFVEGLPGGEYYADPEAALEAYKHQSMFNVIDLATGWKVDLIICKSRPFSQEEFRRRRPLRVDDLRLSIASAEDIIIAKLEWSKLAQSRRQIEDVSGILKVRGESLDQNYLNKWIDDLGLRDEWDDAQRTTRE